jgi:hypothetical protein
MLASLALIIIGTTVKADVLIFDRGLPTANLNNAAGADRSNVAWADYSPYGGANWAIGDDFNFGSTGTFQISDLRVWIVATDSQPLSDMWSDLTLFGGGTDASEIAALSTVSTSGSDPNVSITPVTYADGSSYQGTSGDYINIYQVDFLNLNWTVDGDTTYTFFIGGTPTSDNTSLYGGVSPFLSASNAALSGSTQQGADNLAREISYDGSNNVLSTDSWDSNAIGIWDKSSDINVQVFVTPEPTSILLLGSAILGLGWGLRKKLV